MRRTHAAMGMALGFGLAASQRDPLLSGILLALVTETAALLPDLDIRLHLKHRGITHSLLALILITGLVWVLDHTRALPVALGYGSHLLLDALTVWGVPILYPLKKRYRLARIRTGGRFDYLVGAVALCAGLGALYSMLQVNR